MGVLGGTRWFRLGTDLIWKFELGRLSSGNVCLDDEGRLAGGAGRGNGSSKSLAQSWQSLKDFWEFCLPFHIIRILFLLDNNDID